MDDLASEHAIVVSFVLASLYALSNASNYFALIWSCGNLCLRFGEPRQRHVKNQACVRNIAAGSINSRSLHK